MTQEALKLALDALEGADQIDCDMQAAITAIKEALAQQEQEPVAWVDLQKEAQQIVKSKALWKKFIDGTPLANDIACWMTDFALQHTHPPQRTEPKVCLRSRNEEMTQDEIIEMALVVGTIEDGDLFVFKHHELEAFAKLVAAKEREACAKICDDEANDDTQDEWQACNCCSYLAEKIRARGEA